MCLLFFFRSIFHCSYAKQHIKNMRLSCAVAACLLALPKGVAFHVPSVSLPRTGTAPASSTRFSARFICKKNPGLSIVERGASPRILAAHMSGTLSPKPVSDAGAILRSTSLMAVSAVVESSSLGGKVAGEGAGLAAGGGASKSKAFRIYEKGAEYFTNLFPVWLTLFSLVALKDPSMFAWFTTE